MNTHRSHADAGPDAERGPAGVDRRERAIAALVAAGLSNPEIAVELVLPVHTVESRIRRACARLGLPDRASLAAAAGRPRSTLWDDPI